MNAQTFTMTMLAALVLVVLTGCSRDEGDIGARLHRECASIISAALAVAPGVIREDARRERDALVFQCILHRGNASSGSEWR